MPPVTHEFRTLASEFRYEIDRIKGSRFLASVGPATTEAEAEAFVQGVRDEFPGASHHCWAFRLGHEQALTRSDDDGEPSGSAGRPIAAQIEGHELTNVVAVVTRWFGGTKLGVGGLIRAYGGACGQTLDRAPIETVVVTRRVTIVHPYECSGAIEGILSHHGLVAKDAAYGADVRFTLDVPERDFEAFTTELTERTAGRARLS